MIDAALALACHALHPEEQCPSYLLCLTRALASASLGMRSTVKPHIAHTWFCRQPPAAVLQLTGLTLDQNGLSGPLPDWDSAYGSVSATTAAVMQTDSLRVHGI